MTERDTHETPMMFRMDRGGSHRQVTAILVEQPHNISGRLVTCYAHIGQHSSCDWGWITQHTRPATPDESAPLIRELESLGYSVKAVKRRSPAHRAAFNAEVRRYQQMRRAAT